MTLTTSTQPPTRPPSRPPTPPPSNDLGAGAPTPAASERPRDQKLRIRSYRPSDIGELVGSMVSALSTTWLLFFALTPLYGAPGFVVVSFALFVPIYYAVEREAHGSIIARDRLATVTIVTGGLLALVPLVLIIGYTIQRGVASLSVNFFTEDLATTGPLDPSTDGGALHAIVGTLQQVAIAIVLSVPLGILTAVYLNEVGGRMARVVRFIIDAMSGLPSIVAGLFIYAIWVLQFGFSGGAAGLALAVLMLPTVTRTSEEMLRLVPGGLREASLALGASEWRTVVHVVLPTAKVGIATAVILGTARAIGETAPVLLTAFGNTSMNVNPMSGPQDDLPLFVWAQIRSSVDAPIARAWTGALVLIVLVLLLFSLARLVASRTPGQRRRGGSRARRAAHWLAHRLRDLRRTPPSAWDEDGTEPWDDDDDGWDDDGWDDGNPDGTRDPSPDTSRRQEHPQGDPR